MMVKEKDNFKEGLGAIFLVLGLFIVIGTVGHIEMNETIDWLQVSLNASLGFLLMYGGTKLI